MDTIHPIYCAKLKLKFIKVDNYTKLVFSLNEEQYNNIKSKLEKASPLSKFLPVRSFEWKDETYYNLCVKPQHAVGDFNAAKLAGSFIEGRFSFHKWNYMGKVGVRGEL
eukprot:Lithocolla_globosa_v1_NODE_3242_length_1722_cov_171.113977.p1 type:complete len:109 gc:universal NODE_3242_length_1722_cov_171.113977:451-777(+)